MAHSCIFTYKVGLILQSLQSCSCIESVTLSDLILRSMRT